MGHEVIDLITGSGSKATSTTDQVCGAVAQNSKGLLEVSADLVVGCDGRHSILRGLLGFKVKDLGAPMDVLWFRLPRHASDGSGLEARLGNGHMMVTINRAEYWQIAYLVPKGSEALLRNRSIMEFQAKVADLAPQFKERCTVLDS